MNNSANLKEELIEVAGEVMARSQVPTLRELALQLTMVEKRRQRIMEMLNWRSEDCDEPLDDEQYQLLMDFVLMQAARKNIDSDELILEMQYKFGLHNLRNLPADKVWEALTFVKAYV